MNEFADKYGDPNWGQLKMPDIPALVADAIKRFPEHDARQLLGVIMREQHGKCNPTMVADAIQAAGVTQ